MGRHYLSSGSDHDPAPAPPPPCEQGCLNMAKCTRYEYACEAYWLYASAQNDRKRREAGMKGRQASQEPSPEWAEIVMEDWPKGPAKGIAVTRARRIDQGAQHDHHAI